MATKTIVETPAGESIEVLDDKVWLELTGSDEHALRQFSINQRKIWVVRALYEHGEFTDKSGRATGALNDWCMANYPNYPAGIAAASVTSLFAGDMMLPAVERRKKGKRTFSIKLIALPRNWFMKMGKLIADQPRAQLVEPTDRIEAVAAEQRIDLPIADDESPVSITDQDIQDLLDSVPGVDSPTIYDEQPPLEINIAAQVAMSLLTTCVEIITAGSSAAIDDRVRKLQGDLSEVSVRLSQRLTENDSLRRQLRQAGDELRALRMERDGLRSRLRATEANLTAALKGDAVHAINGEIQKRVDQIMRVAPTSNKGE